MEKIIDSFLNNLKNNLNYSSLTIKGYNRDLKSFIGFLKKEQIDDFKLVNYQVVRTYLNHLHEKKYNKKSISRYLSTLRTFFKYLMHEKIIDTNPIILISNPKIDKKIPNYLHFYEVEKLLDIPDINNPLGCRNYLILELLYSTGIRVSELINIKLRDIDLEENVIKVTGKGSKERYVLFGSNLKEAFYLYLNKFRHFLIKGKESEFLLINKNGSKLSDRGVRLIIDQIVKKSSVNKKISPHVFRHTFATHMLDGGADLKIVQELLGHENLVTTEIYTHVSNELLRKTYLETHPRAKK